MAATVVNDGVARTPLSGEFGFFSVASVNLGVASELTVTAKAIGQQPGIVSICETEPVAGACLNPPATEVSLTIGNTATPTFAVFVQSNQSIPMDPARNRLLVEFIDSGGQVRGATSVALGSEMTKQEAYLQLWSLYFDDWFSPPPYVVPPRALDGKGMEMDLDNDGDLDVVYAKSGIPWNVTWNDEPLVIYRNHRGYGFTKEVIDVVGYHRDFLVTDVNSDGLEDLVLAVFGLDLDPFPGAQDRVLLQTQEGGLVDATQEIWPVRDDTSHGVCGGDFDNDGDIDVMMEPQLSLMMNDEGVYREERDQRLPLLEIDGETYQQANNFEYIHSLWQLSAFWCQTGDVDMDGDIDLILGDHSPTTATDAYLNVVGQSHVMLFNDGTGRFSYDFNASLIPNSHVAEAQATVGMQFLDVNSDGCGDLVTVTTQYAVAQHVNVFTNDCTGHFELTTNHALAGQWTYFLDPFDLNGDGHVDLLTTYDRPYINHLDNAPISRAYINDGDGNFTPREFTRDDLYLGSPLMYLKIRPSILRNHE